MKIKTLLETFSYFFRSAVVVLIAVLFVTSIVYAATTIGSNINTGGNLTVTGNASSTNATTTGYLYVGVGITNPAGFDFGQGDLIISDDFFVNDQATTSKSLWIGSAGTTNNVNMAGGDLYVQDAIEADGDVFVSGGTFSLSTGTPTTTAGLFVGPSGTTSTSTVGVGTQQQSGCLELTKNGLFYACYINPTNDGIQCSTGRCN